MSLLKYLGCPGSSMKLISRQGCLNNAIPPLTKGGKGGFEKEIPMKRMIKKWLFLIACGVVLSPHPVQTAPLDPIIEAAKKEGSVTIGITLRDKSHGKPAGEFYLAAFKKRYPFLKVNFKRVGGAAERERILTEMTSGV